MIAWEELAPGRPARFAAGDRVLVALGPLPGYSLWRQRFPKRDALAVADGGQAFLRAPDPETTALLARWRALPAEARDDAAGATVLAALAARGAPPLAEAAIARLDELPGLSTRLEEPARADLAAALADPERPAPLRVALLRLAGARQLGALRPAVEPRTAEGPPLAAAAWTALAHIDGALPEATLRRLLESGDPEVRAVAAGRAGGTSLEAAAARLARRDPAPAVRAAAVRSLVATRKPASVELAFEALADPAAEVRSEAAQGLGAIGDELVPRLRALAESRTGSEAAGALAALSFAGPAGHEALRAIVRSHPDEATRQLARLFAGEELREH